MTDFQKLRPVAQLAAQLIRAAYRDLPDPKAYAHIDATDSPSVLAVRVRFTASLSVVIFQAPVAAWLGFTETEMHASIRPTRALRAMQSDHYVLTPLGDYFEYDDFRSALPAIQLDLDVD